MSQRHEYTWTTSQDLDDGRVSIWLSCGHMITAQKAPTGPRNYLCSACVVAEQGRLDGPGCTYEPWVDNNNAAVGWKCTQKSTGKVEYVTLVPSFNDGPGDENIFLYQGTSAGDGGSVCYVDLFRPGEDETDEPCDECGALISLYQPSMFSDEHEPSCSLYRASGIPAETAS